MSKAPNVESAQMSSHRNVRLGPRASDRQKELIITFLEEHPSMVRLQCLRRSRELGPELTVDERQRLWRQLAAKTNAEGPLSKTANQWQLWWRKQVHDARHRAAAVKENERITGFCYLSKWRQRILNLVGRLPHTGCPTCEVHEDSDEHTKAAVEVQLIKEPSVVGEVTIPSEGTLSSQDPALIQARLDGTVSSATAAGTTGGQQQCSSPSGDVPIGKQGDGGTGSPAVAPQRRAFRTKPRHLLGVHHSHDIVMALRGMKDATVRQAAALERLAEEVSQQRAVAERQTAALEHLVEELKGFRSIGNLARAISTAFQQQAPESQ